MNIDITDKKETGAIVEYNSKDESQNMNNTKLHISYTYTQERYII